jgi:hypothetical protein
MGDMRDSLNASFSASERISTVTGHLVANPATMAGLYLDAARGDAARALAMLPSTEGPFWSRVASNLRAVSAEDRDTLNASAHAQKLPDGWLARAWARESRPTARCPNCDTAHVMRREGAQCTWSPDCECRA